MTLNASIADYVSIDLPGLTGGVNVTYEVADPTLPDVNVDGSLAGEFTVSANTGYILQVRFPAWVPTGSPSGQAQAAFEDGGVRIGGRLWLKTPVSATVGGPPGINVITYMEPFTQPEGRILVLVGQPGSVDWGLGADVWPQYTDAASGIAPPGSYSLTATIDVTSWP